MNAKQLGLSLVLVDFSGLTAYALYHYGVVGVFELDTRSVATRAPAMLRIEREKPRIELREAAIARRHLDDTSARAPLGQTNGEYHEHGASGHRCFARSRPEKSHAVLCPGLPRNSRGICLYSGIAVESSARY